MLTREREEESQNEIAKLDFEWPYTNIMMIMIFRGIPFENRVSVFFIDIPTQHELLNQKKKHTNKEKRNENIAL